MNFPILYKIAANGKVQTWEVRTEGASVIVTTGYQDGAKTPHVTKVVDPKRSTSLEEQANAVATSKFNDKRKTYHLSVEDAINAGNTLTSGGYKPMLAHMYSDYCDRLPDSVFAQPKLDGIRAIAQNLNGEIRLFSRKGLPITTVPHINKSLASIMDVGDVFDGELYVHGMDFNKLSGLVRANVNQEDTSSIWYTVFDIPRTSEVRESDTYGHRLFKTFGSVDLSAGFNISDKVNFVSTYTLNSHSEISGFHDLMVSKGYEGAILRDPFMPYENKRSTRLLKYKVMSDAEYLITGYEEGSGDLEGCVGSFICRTTDGKQFNVKLAAPEKTLKHYFEHPKEFMGRPLTVQYQQLSEDGIPRFPVGKAIRA